MCTENATIEEIAERAEAALPVDRVDSGDIVLANGAVVQLLRKRVRGVYCPGCNLDLVRHEHDPRCPELAVERETARRENARPKGVEQ